MTPAEEEAIDTKIGAMNKEEMENRFDELQDKDELTEEEDYEIAEIEDRLDALDPDQDHSDVETDDEEADKDN